MSADGAPANRGAFIVFEGLDRSGKSTQSAQLLSRLQAASVSCVDAVWRYPDRTSVVGSVLNEVMAGPATKNEDGKPSSLPPNVLHLLFTANRWERSDKLQSLLDSGVTVVADRYAYSGVAYSVGAEGLPVDWCKQVESGLVAADAVVYLRVDADEAAGRGGYGKERYEKLEIQRRIRAVYEEQFVAGETSNGVWKVVDGGGGKSVEEVGDDVWNAVHPVLSEVKRLPVRLLWQ